MVNEEARLGGFGSFNEQRKINDIKCNHIAKFSSLLIKERRVFSPPIRLQLKCSHLNYNDFKAGFLPPKIFFVIMRLMVHTLLPLKENMNECFMSSVSSENGGFCSQDPTCKKIFTVWD